MERLSGSPPEIAARTSAREFWIEMRWPVPYDPPVQPVLSSHAWQPCSASFLASSSPYTVGCSGMHGAPKHAENVALGSLTPRSVPATLAG